MNSSSVRIAVHQENAAELARELTIVPHSLKLISGGTDADMANLLVETDVLVSSTYKAAWHDAARNLRLVQGVGAGTDGIEFGGLPAGCTACNVYGHDRGVAERVFLLMLALNQGLLGLDAALRRGNWTPQRPYLPELRDRNLLILGLGHIGRELVRWGQFLGMNITVLTRNPSPDRGSPVGLTAIGKLEALAEHIKDADFVVVAIPAAVGTIDLIGARELGLMKATAYLINVGRGPVVNEDALYEALRTHQIAGAGLDVWYLYPSSDEVQMPSRRPFQELDNVIMTPHKPTIETMAYRWKEIAQNIRRLVQGEPLQNVVFAA